MFFSHVVACFNELQFFFSFILYKQHRQLRLPVELKLLPSLPSNGDLGSPDPLDLVTTFIKRNHLVRKVLTCLDTEYELVEASLGLQLKIDILDHIEVESQREHALLSSIQETSRGSLLQENLVLSLDDRS